MPDIPHRLLIDGKTVLPESMPRIYRLMDVTHVAINDHTFRYTATLYHRHLSPRVTWTGQSMDARIQLLALVSIRFKRLVVAPDGALQISTLLPADTPDEHTNLFDTVPPPLVTDPNLMIRGRALVNQLPRQFKRLFNAIFWESERFLWFVVGPVSLAGQYTKINDNLRRSIEVAESALRIAAGHRQVFPALIILGSLLRDSGKAEHYRLTSVHDRFVFTERGRLIGHRLTAVEWLTTAITRSGIEIPKSHRSALMHILSAAPGAPEWLGLCEPQSLEASIIAMADRWLDHDADGYGEDGSGGAGLQPYRTNVLRLPTKRSRALTLGDRHA